MIRKIFKNNSSRRFDEYIQKYKISTQFLAVNRKMVSRAVLIGFFIAFIPMPMQMVAVVALLPFFRFNALIAIAIVWITNPLTMPAIYYVEYLTGNFLLMQPGVHDIELSITWFSENIEEIFIPLYVGALFYSTLFSVGFYYLVNWLWIDSVQKERKNRKNDIQ
ncbi:MAG: DUF2062 domain-containing protein [Campylobacterales bacterium]|nr:DUF2062 domain-containing protein [Campylobacterales bacterium]